MKLSVLPKAYFLLVAALLTAFQLVSVLAVEERTFIGVSCVCLCFNMIPVAYVATLLLDGEVRSLTDYSTIETRVHKVVQKHWPYLVANANAVAGGGGSSDSNNKTSSSTTTSSEKEKEKEKEEKKDADDEHKSSTSTSTSTAAATAATNAVGSNSDAVHSSSIVITKNEDGTDIAEEAAEAAEAASDAKKEAIRRHSLKIKIAFFWILSWVMLWMYAVLVRHVVDYRGRTGAAAAGYATAGAVVILDFCILICIIGEKINSPVAAVAALTACRFLCIIFDDEYYFIGHAFMFLLLSIYFSYSLVKARLPAASPFEAVKRYLAPKKKTATATTTATATEAVEGDVEAGTTTPAAATTATAATTPAAAGATATDAGAATDAAGEEETQEVRQAKAAAAAAAAAIEAAKSSTVADVEASTNSNTSGEKMNPVYSALILNTDIVALTVLSLAFTADVIAAGYVNVPAIQLEKPHSQYIVGLASAFVSFIIFAGYFLVRLFRHGKQAGKFTSMFVSLVLCWYLVIVAGGIIFFHLTNSYIVITLCVILPLLFISWGCLYVHWVKNNFVFLAPAELRSPPHYGFFSGLVRGRLPLPDYIIATLVFFAIAAPVGISIFLHFHVQLVWKSWIIGLALIVIPATVYVIEGWFFMHKFTFAMFITIDIVIGLIALAVGLFYSIKHDDRTAIWPVILAIAYVACALLYFAYRSVRSERWRFTAPTRVALVLSYCLFTAGSIVLAIYNSPWYLGAGIFVLVQLIMLVPVFFRSIWPRLTAAFPRLRLVHIIYPIVAVLLGFALFIGLYDGQGFAGFSIAWGLLFLFLLLSSLQQLNAKDSAVLQNIVGVRPVDDSSYVSSVYISPAFFPIFEFIARQGLINPIQLNNARGIFPLVTLVVVYFWGVVAAYFLKPSSIGSSVSALALVAATAIGINFSRVTQLRFAEALEFYGGHKSPEFIDVLNKAQRSAIVSQLPLGSQLTTIATAGAAGAVFGGAPRPKSASLTVDSHATPIAAAAASGAGESSSSSSSPTAAGAGATPFTYPAGNSPVVVVGTTIANNNNSNNNNRPSTPSGAIIPSTPGSPSNPALPAYPSRPTSASRVRANISRPLSTRARSPSGTAGAPGSAAAAPGEGSAFDVGVDDKVRRMTELLELAAERLEIDADPRTMFKGAGLGRQTITLPVERGTAISGPDDFGLVNTEELENLRRNLLRGIPAAKFSLFSYDVKFELPPPDAEDQALELEEGRIGQEIKIAEDKEAEQLDADKKEEEADKKDEAADEADEAKAKSDRSKQLSAISSLEHKKEGETEDDAKQRESNLANAKAQYDTAEAERVKAAAVRRSSQTARNQRAAGRAARRSAIKKAVDERREAKEKREAVRQEKQRIVAQNAYNLALSEHLSQEVEIDGVFMSRLQAYSLLHLVDSNFDRMTLVEAAFNAQVVLEVIQNARFKQSERDHIMNELIKEAVPEANTGGLTIDHIRKFEKHPIYRMKLNRLYEAHQKKQAMLRELEEERNRAMEEARKAAERHRLEQERKREEEAKRKLDELRKKLEEEARLQREIEAKEDEAKQAEIRRLQALNAAKAEEEKKQREEEAKRIAAAAAAKAEEEKKRFEEELRRQQEEHERKKKALEDEKKRQEDEAERIRQLRLKEAADEEEKRKAEGIRTAGELEELRKKVEEAAERERKAKEEAERLRLQKEEEEKKAAEARRAQEEDERKRRAEEEQKKRKEAEEELEKLAAEEREKRRKELEEETRKREEERKRQAEEERKKREAEEDDRRKAAAAAAALALAKAEEERKERERQAEALRKMQEEEKKRQEAERKRLAEIEKKRLEEEKKAAEAALALKKKQEEEAKKAAAERERIEKQQREAEAKRAAEEEARRKKAAEEEAERKRKEDEELQRIAGAGTVSSSGSNTAEWLAQMDEKALEGNCLAPRASGQKIWMNTYSCLTCSELVCGACRRTVHHGHSLGKPSPLLACCSTKPDPYAKFYTTPKEEETIAKSLGVVTTVASPKELTTVLDRFEPRDDFPEHKVAKESKLKFTDPDFDFNKNNYYGNLKKFPWARISEIYKNPELFIAPIDPNDLCQGQLGDCYLIAAISVLTQAPLLLFRCFVNKTSNDEGIYTVRFILNGRETFVTVDDYVPVIVNRNGSKTPAYAKSTQAGEIYPMLIEKAYAKLFGGYSNIEGGFVSQALAELSGGMAVLYAFKSDKDVMARVASGAFFNELVQLRQNKCLLGAGSNSGSHDNVNDKGIHYGHAYSILDVVEIVHPRTNKPVQLIKLRNPWGTGEWKGEWSDNDSNWTPALKKQLNVQAADDGAFWMPFAEFLTCFRNVYACRFFPQDDWPAQFRIPIVIEGENASGATNNYEVVNAPQYAVTVNSKCNAVFSLETVPSRDDSKRQAYCLNIYKNGGNRITATKSGTLVARLPVYTYDYITLDTTLDASDVPYTLVVTSFKKGDESDVTLKVYSTASKSDFKIEALPAQFSRAVFPMQVTTPGKWASDSVGNYTSPKYKLNPQYSIAVHEDCKVTVVLKPIEKVATALRLYQSTNGTRMLKTATPVVSSGNYGYSGAQFEVSLSVTKHGKTPLVLVPSPFKEADADFEFTVYCSVQQGVSIKEMP